MSKLISQNCNRLGWLSDWKGDALEAMTADQKLCLLVILAIWLSADNEDFEMMDAMLLAPFEQDSEINSICAGLDDDLTEVDQLEESEILGLQLAIAQQLKEGVYLQ